MKHSSVPCSPVLRFRSVNRSASSSQEQVDESDQLASRTDIREFSIAVNGTSGRSRDNVCPIDLRVLVM